MNMEKHELIIVGEVKKMESLVDYNVGNLPTTYLSLPLEARHKLMRI